MAVISIDSVETILRREFPELEVDTFSIPGTGDIKPNELTSALQYIRENKLVQDSRRLIDGTGPLRSSVTYPIVYPKQERELSFRVDWIQGPMVYVGHIQTIDPLGDDVSQARMYGMRLR